MIRRREVVMIVIVVVVMIGLRLGNPAFRSQAQHNKPLYGIMVVLDGMDFVTNGGGPVGYDNFWKWQYAHARKNDSRVWVRCLFWGAGFLYESTIPPDNYAYPPKFNS